jgi:hypothetical protein
MQSRRWVITITLGVAASFLSLGEWNSHAQTPPHVPPPIPTIIEDSKPSRRSPSGSSEITGYSCLRRELEFFRKLSSSEQNTGGWHDDYSINGKVGRFIGWFGIVREIDEDAAKNQTRLLVEMKYFDGMSDTSIFALSFNGAGDFTAVLTGVGVPIQKLSLIRVYGVIAREPAHMPEVNTKYVRQWDWGLFTFIHAYGKQKGSEEWRKLCTVPLDEIYKPSPDEKYYLERLGPRNQ